MATLHPMSPEAGVVSSFLPSRWGLRGWPCSKRISVKWAASADGSVPVIDHDLAEDYFPAESDRMGVRADVMALGAMFIGLTAAVAFISASSKPGR